MKRGIDSARLLAAALLAIGLLVATAIPAKAVPPARKNYAFTLMFVDPFTGEIALRSTCLIFSSAAEGEVCNENDTCGTWEFVEKEGHQNEWISTVVTVDDEGVEIRREIRGITERIGPRSSISGTLVITANDVVLNAGAGGTQVRRSDCLEFGLQDD
jgi:hypothetical protein